MAGRRPASLPASRRPGSMRGRLLARLYARAAILSLPAIVCLVLLVHQRQDTHLYGIPYQHKDDTPLRNKSGWIQPIRLSDYTESDAGNTPQHTYVVDKDNVGLHAFTHGTQNSLVKPGSDKLGVAWGLTQADRVDTSPTVANRTTGRQNKCAEELPPLMIPISGRFQEVYPERSYVFSAYMDLRGSVPLVRVVGISDFRRDGHPRWCRLWYGPNSRAEMVRVRDDIVPETHGTRFVVNIYSCEANNSDHPYAVSLVRERCDTSRNILSVPVPQIDSPALFTVCVAPLHNKYADALQLVDMVESNRQLGADKFIFYNYSSSVHPIYSYLRQYMDEGIAEVIDWPLPVQLQSGAVVDIYYYGQLAAYSDCLYRSLHSSKYIIYLDLDEIIVPRKHDNWIDVINNAPRKDALPVCAFSFRNVFFRTEWPSDERFIHNSTVKEMQINSMLKTKREKSIYPHLQRSKCIYDVRYLEIPGIHQPWKCLEKSLSYHVTTKEGLLHHYRSWGEPEMTKWVYDRSLHRYTDAIIKRVYRRHHGINSHL